MGCIQFNLLYYYTLGPQSEAVNHNDKIDKPTVSITEPDL